MDWSFSSVAAPTKMKATLASSDGWMDTPPIKSQLVAPLRASAKITVTSSRRTATAATGMRSFITRSVSPISQVRMTKPTIPMTVATTCLNRSPGLTLATTVIPMAVRKKPIPSSSRLFFFKISPLTIK